MAAAAILKNPESATVRAILTKFGIMTQFDPLDRCDHYKFDISKIQNGGGQLVKSPYLGRSLSDFNYRPIWSIDAVRPS